MAYFNHAFSKVFLGTGKTLAGPVVTDGGFVRTSGIPTYQLNDLAKVASPYSNGYFGLFNASGASANKTSDLAGCCNVYLAGSAIYSNDKIGPFHGGYQETNKSKVINPRYVSKFYRVDSCEASNNVINIGNTPYTDQEATPNCCHEFLCDETYNLRIDVKGSPALRFLNHNAYLTLDYYTGCCAADSITPTAVNSTNVMIAWANQIINSPLLSPFIKVVVADEAGLVWYAPGTVDTDGDPVANTWDEYDATTAHVDGACAGLVLYGAYVDTKFGDCTFQVSDFYEKEPVKLYASLVDYNGDPCEFEGLCVVTECQGNQAMGLGESVLRDLIQSEAYRQNFFHSDLRIREITQGNQIVNAINRNALYTRYYLLHSVPRFNNPSSTFDNDRYLLEVITNGVLPAFETAVNTWLEGCGNECAFEEFTCVSECTPVVPLVPEPVVIP
jgi:hypothetical protein